MYNSNRKRSVMLPSLVEAMREAARNGSSLREIAEHYGVPKSSVAYRVKGVERPPRKSKRGADDRQPVPLSFMPPREMQSPHRILDYAPPSSAMLGGWLRSLPDEQFKKVWKAIFIEQWGECSRHYALQMLQAVDDRFVSVKKVTHGSDIPSKGSDTNPDLAA